jgi:hypothetical protein
MFKFLNVLFLLISAKAALSQSPQPCPVNAGPDLLINCQSLPFGAPLGDAPTPGLNYTWSPTNYLTNSNTSNPYFTPPANTSLNQTYTLTVTDLTNNCIQSSDVVVVQVNNTLPSAWAGSGFTKTCTQYPTGKILGVPPVAGITYSWTPGSGLSNPNIPNPFANPSSTTFYTLTATNPINFCSSTDTLTVKVNIAPPQFSMADSLKITCQLNANGANLGPSPNPQHQYVWSPSFGLNNPSIANPVAFPAQSQTYSLTVQSIVNGCQTTKSTHVKVDTLKPNAQAGNPFLITCSQSPQGELRGTSSLANHSYQWLPTLGVTTPNSSQTNLAPTSATLYTLTTTNLLNGCFDLDSVLVTVDIMPPSIDAGNDQNLCSGTITSLNASGGVSYQWSNNLNNGQLFIPTYSGFYSVVGTGSNGCSSSDSLFITVNTNPNINAGNDTSLCLGNSFTPLGSGASILIWNNGIANGQPFIPQSTSTYQLTGIDSNGCSGVDFLHVTVKPLPELPVLFDIVKTCNSNPNGAFLNYSSIPNTSHVWSPSTGLNDSTLANPFANPVSNLIYTLAVTDSITQCKNSNSLQFHVNQIHPSVFAGSDQQKNCILNSNGVQIGQSPEPGVSYSWSPTAHLSNSNIANPVANPISTTAYILTATNQSNGCFSADTIDFSVDNQPPVVSAGNDTAVCYGSIFTLTGHTNSSQCEWYPVNQLTNPFDCSTAIQAVQSSQYILKVTGSNQCINTDTLFVLVIPFPSINLSEPQATCKGSFYQIALAGQYDSVLWGGLAAGMNGANFELTASSSGYVVVNASNQGLCAIKDSIFIEVLPKPNTSILGDSTSCKNSFWQEYESPNGNFHYFWNVANGNITGNPMPNKVSIHWQNTDTGYVRLIAEDKVNQCKDTAIFRVYLSGLAPDTIPINLLSPTGKVLYLPLDFPIINWGQTIIQNGQSAFLNVITQYCHIPNFNPAAYYYWADYGTNPECLTRSFYNLPNFPTGIESLESKVQIFPNPNTGSFSIQNENGVKINRLTLTGMDGKVIYEQKLDLIALNRIILPQYVKGIYILTLWDDNKPMEGSKIAFY